ncbi:RNA polymerase sigma factor [Thermodesulfobacteriota bacterium]
MSFRKTDETDHGLINKIRQGSMDAMEKIVARYENAIFNFGLKMCGQRQDAEDVAQDTFLNALKSMPGFREETKLKNWLFRIAANACLRKRRKRKHEPEREISLEGFIDNDTMREFEIPDWSTNPDNALMKAEFKSVIDNAIRELPPGYRMVFTLRDIEGFNTEETAEIIGISKQLVKTRLHRARFSLRKSVSDQLKGGTDNG